MTTKKGGKMPTVEIPYDSIRNISSPEDVAQERKVYAGHLPAQEILKISTNENVRDYLVEAEGKKLRSLTNVHRAIHDTLVDRPEQFSILNGGLVLVARSCEIDDKKKTLKLTRPSIINGSQTQGVLRDFFAEYDPPSDLVLHITYELIVTDDEDLIAEISIARNFQNNVLSISIAGRRGQLDELEKVMRESDKTLKLRKKESQFHGEDFLNTEKLLQVLMVLTPPFLLGKEDENECQIYAYNRKEKCIKEYGQIHSEAKDPKHQNHQKSLALYNYFLQIAPQAWRLYESWKCHPGFKGTRLKAIDRDHSGDVVEVPDGIVFPILSALAIFAEQSEGEEKRWAIRPPSSFTELDLIKAAKTVYQEIALSKPHLMGKSRSCYMQLRQITALYKKLSAPR